MAEARAAAITFRIGHADSDWERNDLVKRCTVSFLALSAVVLSACGSHSRAPTNSAAAAQAPTIAQGPLTGPNFEICLSKEAAQSGPFAIAGGTVFADAGPLLAGDLRAQDPDSTRQTSAVAAEAREPPGLNVVTLSAVRLTPHKPCAVLRVAVANSGDWGGSIVAVPAMRRLFVIESDSVAAEAVMGRATANVTQIQEAQ
jgi:hypothetical protein